MGINPVALIWERSALVLILIFMSGWLRDEEARREEQPGQAPPAIDYEAITRQLAQQLAPQITGIRTSIIEEVRVLIPTQEQITGAITPLLPAPTTEPAPALDYEQLAQQIAPLLSAPEPGPAPELDYSQIAQTLAPYLKPQLTEIRRVIVEEVKTAIPQIVTPPPAPQIESTTSQERDQAAALSNTDQQQEEDTESDQDEAPGGDRDERLERIYQELKSAAPGKSVSGRQLAPAAHVSRRYCNQWLRERHRENEKSNTDQQQEERDTDKHAAVYTLDKELAGATN